ncbi:uncharacterized protein LOC111679738 [Lucilia cuprina]|uniref:uncharacterized protein LOC111679738 n=1 Tax=Lucilia cuprina TaxID=7375 RepID=UPI001F064D43|nr:uncharacterized protein LOC111679738 [Lucilia cuprina]
MTDVPQIIELDKVIEPHLDGGKLLTYNSRYLTKPGDNYGSVLLAINAKIQTKCGTIKELPLIAKLPPITNELLWQMFQPERTCLTENAVYTYLSPALKELQIEAGIHESMLYDGLSKYYGSRISLDPKATKVDTNAVLVQENLQTLGFRAGNRHKMFDLQHARVILPQVAQFHALAIALRMKKPEDFNKNIRPNFRRFDVNNGMSEEAKLQFEQELLDDVVAATGNDEIILQRVRELINEYNNLMSSPDKEDDLYTTIVHFDMWINNLMIKYDENNLPCQVKIIDFQMAEYESLVYDVIFFMFSSLEIEVLEHYTNELFLLYYNSLIKCLNSVGISTKPYSFESFLSEIHKYAPVAICLVLFMIRIILADDSIMPDNFNDVNMEVLSKNGNQTVTRRTADVIRLAQKYDFFFRD